MTTDVHVGTQMVRLRARFDENDPMSIVDAQDRLYDLCCFMQVGYSITAATTGYRRGARSFTDVENIAVQALVNSRVKRLNYNSPLEIVVTITSVAGAVTLAGEALLRLWRGVQESRVATAHANTEVLAQRIVQTELEHVLSELNTDERTSVRPWVEGAARAALTMKQLEIEPDYE